MKFLTMKSMARLTLSAALLTLAACTTGPGVQVQVDPGADFSQYRTFAFVSPLGTDHDGYQSIVSQELKAATQHELEARGLRLDTTAPQLLINFNTSLDDKLRIISVPMPVYGMGGGYYGYRYGMYSPWPMYNDTTIIRPYQQGTLNIDVVDAARKQLVWESVVTDSVTQKDLNNMQAALRNAVAAAFAKFPIAGPAKPH
jgi:hypothetical protein